MSWFIFSILCICGWGCADLFYKLGTDEDDRNSHLKITVCVGAVMGIVALCIIPFTETLNGITAKEFFSCLLRYSPASLSYILSMVIGYAGLRYLEVSIVSPVQNASGALSAALMLVWFLLKGKISSVTDELCVAEIIGTVVIVGGVIALAIVENRLGSSHSGEKKYRFGALALLFPILYCVFDTIGTAADGILLTEENGMAFGEMDVLVLYGLTFLLAGIVAYIVLRVKTGKLYNPFAKGEGNKWVAAMCEEAGQIFYVYAMALRPVLAAPMVASYCILSLVLSTIFADERLKKSQYVCVALVVAGIVLLGICEGLNAL